MKKEVKIWVGKKLNGGGGIEKRGTLKSLCEVIGVSYNTAKVKQDKDGGVTLWPVDGVAWEVWVERISK